MGLLPVIRTWQEWGAVFTKPGVWAPAIQEICRREHIPVTEIKAGYPGTNAVFSLDNRYIIKIYAPFCHTDYDLERVIYLILEKETRIPAPRLLASGVLEDDISWPYIVIEFLQGGSIRELRGQLSSANRLAIAGELGNIVQALHAIPLPNLTRMDTSLEGWQEWLRSRSAQCVQENQVAGVLSAAVLDEIPPFIERVISESSTGLLMLINGDLTEDHLLLDQKEMEWQISGLIDFADALVGQQGYEWPALWFGALNQQPDELRAFMHAYDSSLALDKSFVEKAMAWTFLHEFGSGIIADTLSPSIGQYLGSISELAQVLW